MDLTWHETSSQSRKKQVVLAAVVDGVKFYSTWQKYALPSWKAFAQRHGYCLVTASNVKLGGGLYPGWAKVLLPQAVTDILGEDSVTVVLDADQAFSPLAPPIELVELSEDFGFVPLSLDNPSTHSFRNLAFLRRTYLDTEFPLDSILHCTEKHWSDGELIASNGHQPFSAGFVAVPAGRSDAFAELLNYAHSSSAKHSGNPGGGDQLVMIRELSTLPHYLLDRRWQVIWPEYMAEHRPDLYARAPLSQREAALAVATALFSSWCLHFSTSWPEKEYWGVSWESAWIEYYGHIDAGALLAYRNESIDPVAYGRVKPPDARLVEID